MESLSMKTNNNPPAPLALDFSSALSPRRCRAGDRCRKAPHQKEVRREVHMSIEAYQRDPKPYLEHLARAARCCKNYASRKGAKAGQSALNE